MKLTEYRVAGAGTFPLDMLRYDHSWPATTDDALTISSVIEGDTPPTHRVQVLVRGLACTPDRWASFGWPVVDGPTKL